MKIRILGLLLGATALAGWGTGCEQPAIDCRAARGSFASKYVLQTGTGACSELKGDVVGLQSYYPASADNKTVDLSRSLLSVKASRITEMEGAVGELIGEGCAEPSAITKSNLNAIGDFTSVDPDGNAVCSVPSSSVSEFQSNEIAASGDPMDMENACGKGLPAIDIKYEWRNVRVLVSPDAPGTRFEADLTYTESGCSATYKVCGLWPAVDCAKYVLDDMGEPVRTEEPEQKLCDAVEDPEPPYGIPYGSGINVDFGAVCDPDTLLCVLPQCPIL